MVTIKEKLLRDIEQYCALNGIDADNYVNDLLRKSFMVDKYGEKPGVPLLNNKKRPFKKRVVTKYTFVFEKKKEEAKEETVHTDDITLEEKPKKRKLNSR